MALNPQSILLRRLSQAGLVDTGLAQRLIVEKSHQYQNVAELLIAEKLITAKSLAENVAAFTMHSLIDLDFYDLEFRQYNHNHVCLQFQLMT